jgi:hypothetical protein
MLIFRHNTNPRKLASSVCYLLHAGFMLGVLFDPEDGGDIFLRNVGRLSTDYTALYPEDGDLILFLDSK